MEVKGDFSPIKDNAGVAILEAFKDAKGLEPVPIGSYRGFSMSLTVENFGKDFILTLKGRMSHRVELGKDAGQPRPHRQRPCPDAGAVQNSAGQA